jgi:adenylate kinase
MIILVTGLDDSGRDDIVGMVLQSHKGLMPLVSHVRLSDFLPDLGDERSLARLTAIRDNSVSKLEKSVISLLKKGGNIVISGCATKGTIHGYMPVMTEDFTERMKPDLIIFMEVLPHHADAYMEHEHIDWLHQSVEKHITSVFSLNTGAPLRVIKVRPGKIKDAMREALDAMRAAMG